MSDNHNHTFAITVAHNAPQREAAATVARCAKGVGLPGWTAVHGFGASERWESDVEPNVTVTVTAPVAYVAPFIRKLLEAFAQESAYVVEHTPAGAFLYGGQTRAYLVPLDGEPTDL